MFGQEDLERMISDLEGAMVDMGLLKSISCGDRQAEEQLDGALICVGSVLKKLYDVRE